MEVDDDATFLRNYYEAYAVFKANNPDPANDLANIITESTDKVPPPNIEILRELYTYINADNKRAQEREKQRLERETQRVEREKQRLAQLEQEKMDAEAVAMSVQVDNKDHKRHMPKSRKARHSVEGDTGANTKRIRSRVKEIRDADRKNAKMERDKKIMDEKLKIMDEKLKKVRDVIKADIEKIRASERHGIELITLKPSLHYPSFDTFNFGSVRCQDTQFDLNFDRDSNESMLFFISMHGSICADDNKVVVNKCKSLNKFSASGAGQCTQIAHEGSKYIAYALAEAVANNGILDISTILREGNAHHSSLKVNISAVLNYEQTLPTAISQHNYGIAKHAAAVCAGEDFQEIVSSEILGDKTTFGIEYVEKGYSVKTGHRDGIFICKDWPEIGAKSMDNLLENQAFINYILNTYIPSDVPGTFDFVFTTIKPLITGSDDDVRCVKRIFLSELIEFSEKNGRPEVNVVDNSCSVLMGMKDFTCKQIDRFKTFLDSLGDNVAKGVKRTKKGSRYNKTTRVKGNRGKPKGTKKGKRVIKNKRTRGR